MVGINLLKFDHYTALGKHAKYSRKEALARILYSANLTVHDAGKIRRLNRPLHAHYPLQILRSNHVCAIQFIFCLACHEENLVMRKNPPKNVGLAGKREKALKMIILPILPLVRPRRHLSKGYPRRQLAVGEGARILD